MNAHFVTGASGFLGRHLVRALLLRGDRVIILLRDEDEEAGMRRTRSLFPDAPERLTFCVGDITKEDLGLSEKTRAEIALIRPELWHLAADLSFDAREHENIFRTNVEGTINVVRFANRNAKRLWHMSTAYVQGEPAGVIIEQGLAPAPVFRNHYESTKYTAEKAVRKMAEVPFVIIRPSIVLGDAYRAKALGCAFGYYRYLHIFYRFHAWILRGFRGGGVPGALLRIMGTRERRHDQMLTLPWLFLPEPRDGKVNVVPVTYVIDTMISLIDLDHPSGMTVHLVHDNPPTYTFLLDVLFTDLRISGGHHFPVPKTVFIAGLRMLRGLVPSIRVYAHSALWYVPYIGDNYDFETTKSRAMGIPPPPRITREYMSQVNRGAISAIEQGVG